MDTKTERGGEQRETPLYQAKSLDEALAILASLPKRKYTEQEIEEARGKLALMNDRVFLVTFMDNKNNRIVTGIANAVRKIHKRK